MSDTTDMTTTTTEFEPLKTDALGRLHFSHEQRETILDAFETSGLSGAAFARHCGINYQTLASWIQKRRQQRGDGDSGPSPNGAASSLVEVELNTESEKKHCQASDGSTLEIQLPGGARTQIDRRHSLALAAALLHELERSRPC